MGNIDDQAEGHEDLEARPKFDNRHSCSCGFCIRGQSGRIGGRARRCFHCEANEGGAGARASERARHDPEG